MILSVSIFEIFTARFTSNFCIHLLQKINLLQVPRYDMSDMVVGIDSVNRHELMTQVFNAGLCHCQRGSYGNIQ